MIYAFGDFVLDDQRYQLQQSGKVVKIEPQVLKFLLYLILNRDRVVSRDELFEKLWPSQVVSDAALTYCVAKARKAVRDDGSQQRIIKTQHRSGYRFVAHVTIRVEESSLEKVPISEDKPIPVQRAPRTSRQSGRLMLVGLLFVCGWITSLWQLSLQSPVISGALFTARQEASPAVTPTEGKLCQWLVLSTHNEAALEYLLRGWEYYNLRTPVENTQARQMFQRAIELDPRYAAAYASLGWLYWREWWSWSQNPRSLEQAALQVQKAIALDASCPYVHLLLADVYLMQKRHAQAIAAAKQAITLDPTCARCYGSLATVLTFAGQPQEALGAVENARRLDPTAATSYAAIAGHAYRLLGRYEEAITALRRALSRHPSDLFPRAHLVIVYSELGREEEARTELVESSLFTPHASLDHVKPLMPYADEAEAERLLTALRHAGLP